MSDTKEAIRKIGNQHMSRINNPVGVLCRLAQELAYTRKRMCLRHATEVQALLEQADALIENAIRKAEFLDADFCFGKTQASKWEN